MGKMGIQQTNKGVSGRIDESNTASPSGKFMVLDGSWNLKDCQSR
jgi:hypothetical protein